MKAIRVDSPGGPERLCLVQAPRPVPGPGQVLIRLQASGVNFADILCRRAEHPGMSDPPLILGCEGSGTVEACGQGCQTYQGSERVCVYAPWGGTYAEWITAPESYVLPIPDTMSFQEGAAFTHTFLTAYHALFTLGKAREGDWLLITAAAGGVGTAVVRLAQEYALKVIGCVGSDAKKDVLDALGVEHQINYETSDLARRVSSITQGAGVDLALESVGGRVFDQALDSLAPLGRLVLFGIAGGDPPSVSPFQLLPGSLTWGALNLSVLFAHTNHLIGEAWEVLMDLYEQGRIGADVHHTYPLREAAAAHRLMESRASTGKILLLIEPTQGSLESSE